MRWLVWIRKLFIFSLLLAVSAWWYAQHELDLAKSQHLVLQDKERILLVGKGDTLSKIIYRLAAEGVLQRPRWLLLHVRMQDASLIRTGEYLLTPDLTGLGLLERLADGKVIQYQVTFIEGSRFSEAMAQLRAQPKLIDDVQTMTTEHYQQLFGVSPTLAEGWFFPDTYTFVSGEKVSDILLQANRKMRAVLEQEWQQRAEGLPYQNPQQALVMASIIEKETGAAAERPQIAGVFVRRLQKGMKLQTDPTVIYGLGDAFHGNLKRSHLQEYTPYNTYVIDGLPPTPIALPGRAAIHAALHPAAGKALFFVAKGDGTHAFSDTLEQHESAVRQFQLNRADDYRSTTRPL